MKLFNLLKIVGIVMGIFVMLPCELSATAVTSDSLSNLPAGLKPVNSPADGFGAALFQTIFALIFVLGIIYLGVWIMRKFMHKPVLNRNAIFTSLGDYYLDSKKKLSLVRIADRILILGVAENSINLILELDAKTDGKIVLENLQKSDQSKVNFQNILNQFRGKQNTNEN